MMLIVGLTGPICSGKSTVEKFIKELNIPVLDADHAVHELYKKGSPIVGKLTQVCKQPLLDNQGNIDRSTLSKLINKDKNLLTKIEEIVHPAVRSYIHNWLTSQHKQNIKTVVLSIPLMFDAGFNELCDVIICCACNEELRMQRFLERPNTTKEKWDIIKQKQMSSDEYQRKSDHVIRTDITILETQKELTSTLQKIKNLKPVAFQSKW